ncbi:MAG: hypothetical protein NTU51_05695 [Bacteroidetes bacterium]|nr:hypothetical protein [Bacteroidota bacterium]
MRSIKFTEAELEFLVGQYKLELIEAEKYIGEIQNILKKLGVISKDISVKNENKPKRGRGRPAKATKHENRVSAVKETPEPKKKKAGKPGRPKKRGPKKETNRAAKPALKPIESKLTAVKTEKQKPAPKKAKKKAKPAKPSAVKTVKKVVPKAVPEKKEEPKKAVPVKKAAKKKVIQKKKSSSKPKAKSPSAAEEKPIAPVTPPDASTETKPAQI